MAFAKAVALAALVLMMGEASAQTVTCKLTADDTVVNVYVDGATIPSFTPGSACAIDWNTACTITFTDTSAATGGQLIGIEASDATGCATTCCTVAGLIMVCSSTLSGSAWNNVRSDTTTWRSRSVANALAAGWAATALDDTVAPWNVPQASTLATFSCATCGNNGAGSAGSKIWACVLRADGVRAC
jgi:hypothetical protein